MLFPTVTFAVFFTAVYAGHVVLCRRPVLWQGWMLAASAVFYAWWSVSALMVLAGLAAFSFAAAHMVARTRTRRGGRVVLGVCVAAVVAGLVTFRYLGFLAENVNALSRFTGVAFDPPRLVVVLGISFVSFEAISYLVDVHRGLAPSRSPLEVGLFLSFFPHVLAGPILRAEEFFSQLRDRTRPATGPVGVAGALILSGLAKKVVLAEILAGALIPVRIAPQAYSGLDNLVFIVANPLRIFCDVSAYSDIAIGLALLMGIRFPENFRKPFAAASMMEFWHRWHMTVTGFFRDYLYGPLRGSSTGLRMAAAAFVTFVVSGLWHGAAWSFVCWGVLQGAAVVGEGVWRMRRIRAGRRPRRSRPRRVLAVSATYGFVALSGLLFAGLGLGGAATVIGRVVHGSWPHTSTLTPLVVAAVVAAAGIHAAPPRWGRSWQLRAGSWHPVIQGTVFAVAVAVIFALAPAPVSSFLYYRF